MDRPEQEAPVVLPEAVAESPRQPKWVPARHTSLAVNLGKLLYTHNPFYVASAWMVFSGLRASFKIDGSAFDTWALTLSLAGYTLLLSVTAYLVIRLGKVWDDARSLLLLIVLMLLGISVTFDGILAATPELGTRYYLGGWLFSAAVSESLLRSLRLRLGGLFRLPFHLLLGLFFVYPLILAPRLVNPDDPILAWELFAFSSVAAVIFLLLLPAVRRQAGYVADNGSPWPWPWYPWVLFGMLGFCVALRAYYLCLSLHFVGNGDSIFGGYFLVPLGMAGAVLLLEAGLASGSQRLLRRALYAPLAIVLLAAIGHRSDVVYERFLSMFVTQLGVTPLGASLWLATGFYLLATLRGVLAARHAVAGILVALAVLPWTASSYGSEGPRPLLLGLAGLWELGLWLRWRAPLDLLLGVCLGLYAAAVAARDTWFGAWHGAPSIHLLWVLLLGIGYFYRDATGRLARRAAAALALALATFVAWSDRSHFATVPEWLWIAYPLALGVALAGYSRATGDSWCWRSAVAAGAIWLAAYLGPLYRHLQLRILGLMQLAWGALFFLLAAAISLFKSSQRPAWLRLVARPQPPPTGGVVDGP